MSGSFFPNLKVDGVSPPFAVVPGADMSALTVQGGFVYQVVFGENQDAQPCGAVRGVWDHPN
jgi:hypothetical protein